MIKYHAIYYHEAVQEIKKNLQAGFHNMISNLKPVNQLIKLLSNGLEVLKVSIYQLGPKIVIIQRQMGKKFALGQYVI